MNQVPGGELVITGLQDLATQTRTNEALLVCAAEPSLRFLGFELEPLLSIEGSYEHALYESLEESNPMGAYAEYNALIQRMFSFTQHFRR